MNGSSLFGLPVLIPLILLQSALFAYIPIAGTQVQVVIVLVLAVALWRNSAEATIWAFTAGLLIDLNSIAPFGSSALALIVAVMVINPFRANLLYNRVILPFLLAAGAMVLFQMTYLLVLKLGNRPINADIITLLPATVLVHALLALPCYWLLRATNRLSRKPYQINL
ncbi:MAG TPA: rod shape-determining protein MreD [Anaerolineae bacterium]|nr:rod shape-determining protein MreD [Anaerolineae bacterium]